MNIFYVILVVLLLPLAALAQQLELITPLHSTVKEASGVLYLHGRIITHNDSGDEPKLYEVNPQGGGIVRTVYIKNATHVDWEDICHDDTYIYIGDIGNNTGNRTDLRIYKVSLSEYLNTTTDTVTAQTISYSYADQTDFNPSRFTTNYDAEALVAYKDKLYLFTKNWGNYKTSVYEIPKSPGTYKVNKVAELNVNGLVSGADFSYTSNEFLISAYDGSGAFVTVMCNFLEAGTTGCELKRQPLSAPAGYSAQLEGIAIINENECYLVAEQNDIGLPALYRLRTRNLLNVPDKYTEQAWVSPNPASYLLQIHLANARAEIYSLTGVLVLTSEDNQVDVSGLRKGIYLLVLNRATDNKRLQLRLVIN